MVAAQFKKNDLDVQLSQAKQLHISGDLKQAEKRYEKLLRKYPSNRSLLSLMGGLLLQQKKYKESIGYLERAFAKNQDDADVSYNLGLAYYHLKSYEKSIHNFQLAIAKNEQHDRAYYMMAKAYLEWDYKLYQGEAFQAYLLDIQITDRLDSYLVVSEILLGEQKYEDARAFARKVLTEDPNNETALFVLAKSLISENYNNANIDVRHAEPIIKAGNLMLQINPQSWRGHHVIAEALAMIGENDLALQHYSKVNELVPDLAVNRTNTGVLLLRQGRFKEGWEEIAYRSSHGSELYGMGDDALANCTAQPWKGEIEAGKSLFIASEQGIGDQFLHSQILKELIDAGMTVHMTCNEKIVALMRRSLPYVNFYASEHDMDLSVLDRVDYKADLLDLGKYLRDDISKFKEPFHFLVPDPDLKKEFQAKYQKFGDKLKVGISWKSISRSVGSIKSTELQQWQNILLMPGIQFINIQYGDVADEIESIQKKLGVEIHCDDFDPFFDIEKAVAQISALDMVISVSNAAVHMSGQLNIPTWVILNNRPLWHWFETGDRTVWYESLKLFRKQQIEDWEPVLHRVACALSEKMNAHQSLGE